MLDVLFLSLTATIGAICLAEVEGYFCTNMHSTLDHSGIPYATVTISIISNTIHRHRSDQ